MLRISAPHAAVLAAAACLFAHRQAAGQESGPKSWRTQLEFGMTGASGNSSFSILRAGFSVKRLQTDTYELETSALVRHGRNDSKTIADDASANLKFDYRPEETFSPFVFGLVSYDRIRKLARKVNGGAGAKYTFLKADDNTTKASLSLAALWDYEKYTDDQPSQGFVRWSWRLKFDHDFGGGASFEHAVFYQPQAAHIGDYLVDATTSLTSKLLSNVSVVVNHEYLHDSVPPDGVRPDDQKFSVVLRLAL